MALPVASELTQLQRAAQPLRGDAADYDGLLDRIGDARIVLIGESSHGTHEFYRERAAITRRLILELGFTAVAAEADWPDAYRVNRFLRGESADTDAQEALQDFRRFPAWMWRNTDVLAFVEWARAHNRRVRDEHRVGFYGLDLYSLRASMQAVLAYLDRLDPGAARQARARYACFDQFDGDPQVYGLAAAHSGKASCEDDVVTQLVALRARASDYLTRGGRLADDDYFFAEQNAQLVRDAEAYYRAMFRGRVSSWNLRDRHMQQTLQALDRHLSRAGRPVKIVVWAHNPHLGDARATEMQERGEFNLGQLVRMVYPRTSVLVGLFTYAGTVTAASDWDAPAQRVQLRPALPGSYEALFHALDGNFLLRMDHADAAVLALPRLQRAVGVVYRPESERQSHYFTASLQRQFDVVLHFDQTRALKPLELNAAWQEGELPETFPSGM